MERSLLFKERININALNTKYHWKEKEYKIFTEFKFGMYHPTI